MDQIFMIFALIFIPNVLFLRLFLFVLMSILLT